jgi:hypothetical protein
LRNIYKCGDQPRHMYVFEKLRIISIGWEHCILLSIITLISFR